ncbi:MAG TPA: type IV secretion system protein VirB10 [Eoetvoesiella sp.]
MSEAIKEEDFSQEPAQESHEFTGEIKKRGRSRVLALAMMFGVLLVALLLAIWFGKTKLADWRAERDAAQAAKQAAAAQGANQRRGRDFDISDFLSKPESKPAPPEPKQLPENFNQPGPVASVPPIPLAGGGTGAGQAPAAAPVLPPMMLSGENKPRPATVQDQARLTARKSMPSKTEQASAADLGDRSFVITRGSYIPCILQTQLLSNVPGQSGCVIPDNIYSDDGSRLLVPRGSTVVGQYGQTLQNGDSRIAVVWERIKTTNGYVIDVDSGAADGVGTMGVGGFVDNHWGARIGAALLLSLIDDAVDIAVASQQGSGDTVYGNSTSRSSKNIAEKVLDSTVNIKPTLSANRGARLMIYVSKDLWFDGVYEE